MSNSGWEIAQLNSSHVIRMDVGQYHSYPVFISLFGEVFHIAQQLQSEGILDRPYKVAVVIPKIESYKNREPEDNLTRMMFILNKFVPPEKGIAITFYEHWQEKKVIKPFGTSWVWPYKDQWDKNKCEDYVVLQNIDGLDNDWRFTNIEKTYSRIIDELDVLAIDYKVVGYHMKIEEVYHTLLNSKLLIAPPGSSYVLAGGLGLPTLAFGHDWFAVTDNYVMKKPMGTKELIPVLYTGWGNWAQNDTKIVHFDKENGLHNRPQSNTINIGKFETDRDYEILRQKIME